MGIRLLSLTVALVASLALTDGVQAYPLVNGGFETGDFSGWTLSGNTGFTGVDHGTTGFAPGPHGGSFAAFFGAVGSVGVLSQSIATIPGASYDLAFFVANDGVLPNGFQLSWNGTVLTDRTNLPAFGYTEHEFYDLMATSSTTPLQFAFRNDGGNFYLDDIYIGAAGVPEPTTLLLWGTTTIGLALARRYRRRQR